MMTSKKVDVAVYNGDRHVAKLAARREALRKKEAKAKSQAS